MKKDWLLRRLFLSLLCVLSIFLLTACYEGGQGEILSKDTLRQNLSEASEDHAFVFEYLDEWDFPLFGTSKIKRIETLYKKYYYKDLPSDREHATLTAEYFIENYYDRIDLTDKNSVTEALISSYVEAVGDDYSYYRSPDEYESYSESMSGSFVGIGITVSKANEGRELLVIEVTTTTAADAGILADDRIVAVDGATVAELGYTEAVKRVKGEEGTSVTLTVIRGSDELTITVPRVKITENTVEYSITDGIGYVKISGFKSNTDEQFRDAVAALIEADVKGVVYDLRSNTGGYLASVENMLDRLAPKGTELVSFTHGYADPYLAKTAESFILPSVVLCNGRTASAAELFTAGVRDLCKSSGTPVAIVGVGTFGKGVMQRTYTLSDGSAVTFTVAYYNPPSGENYDGVGITPDQEVILTENGDSQLDAAMAKIVEIVNNY